MSRGKKFALGLGDALIFYVSLALTLLVRYPTPEFHGRFLAHLWPFSILLIIWLLSLSLFDLYRQRSFVNYNAVANRIMAAALSGVLASIVLFYLFPQVFRLTPKTNLFIFTAAFAILEYAWRSLFLATAKFRPAPAIIIGSSPEIRHMVEHLKKSPHVGLLPVAWLEALDEPNAEKLKEVVQKTGARVLIVQPKITKDAAVVRELYELLGLGVTILNFTDLYEQVFERVPLNELEEGWFIEHVTTLRPSYDRAKRAVDVISSLLMLIILSPFMAIAAILIKLSSPGPVLYKQQRTGRNDRPFILYKFRTMLHGGEGSLWTEKHDARITPAGKILRATHIDEFPQLVNILRGDISFTGPRPERVELVQKFREFPYYDIRHVVKPGLTGWAQINYRPSASLEEGKEKLCYDIYYIKNRSFFLDLAILFKTIKYVFIKAE
jgi:exopolysaccharide biosynthesis polyprenyl glycosylphosphotransferase